MDKKQWDQFLAPYKQAVEELKVKLKGIRKLYEFEDDHSPVEFVTGRVKPVASILEKAKRKNIPMHEIETMQDIAGLRIMCQFVEDIQVVKKCSSHEKTSWLLINATILQSIKKADTVRTTLLCYIRCKRLMERSSSSSKSKFVHLR